MNSKIYKNNSATQERLVGWLVSYALNEMGYYYEIRSGRSLITSERAESIRLLTLEEDSVSAPHAALRATPKHKVMIQDIFSESGTYITKTDNKEIPINGPMKLEHGDWIRVGKNSRFQVCLIDGPSK